MNNYPERTAVIDAIELIDTLTFEQLNKVPGVTDELIRRAKQHALTLIQRFTDTTPKKPDTYQGDYSAYLRSILAKFEAASFDQAVSETRIARMTADEWHKYQQMPFDAPNELEQRLRRTLQNARQAFILHFHCRPIVPWTFEQLEQMATTGEFVDGPMDAENKGVTLLKEWDQENTED
jgi:hypothetical protein